MLRYLFKRKEQFSIRKLSLGVASVMIGASLVTGNETEVQAATKNVEVHYVSEKDLTSEEKLALQKFDENQVVTEDVDVYYYVYRPLQKGGVLPNTTTSPLQGVALVGTSLLVLAVFVSKKKSKIITATAFAVGLSGILQSTVLANDELNKYFENIQVTIGDKVPTPKRIAGYEFTGTYLSKSLDKTSKSEGNEVTRTVEPTQPVIPEPEKPVEPTQPATPEPEKPVEPTQPATPEPEKPVEPTQPVTPEPEKPVEPTQPIASEPTRIVEPAKETKYVDLSGNTISPAIQNKLEEPKTIKDYTFVRTYETENSRIHIYDLAVKTIVYVDVDTKEELERITGSSSDEAPANYKDYTLVEKEVKENLITYSYRKTAKLDEELKVTPVKNEKIINPAPKEDIRAALPILLDEDTTNEPFVTKYVAGDGVELATVEGVGGIRTFEGYTYSNTSIKGNTTTYYYVVTKQEEPKVTEKIEEVTTNARIEEVPGEIQVKYIDAPDLFIGEEEVIKEGKAPITKITYNQVKDKVTNQKIEKETNRETIPGEDREIRRGTKPRFSISEEKTKTEYISPKYVVREDSAKYEDYDEVREATDADRGEITIIYKEQTDNKTGKATEVILRKEKTKDEATIIRTKGTKPITTTDKVKEKGIIAPTATPNVFEDKKLFPFEVSEEVGNQWIERPENGEQEITYEVVYEKGVEKSRKEVERKTIKNPNPGTIRVGVRKEEIEKRPVYIEVERLLTPKFVADPSKEAGNYELTNRDELISENGRQKILYRYIVPVGADSKHIQLNSEGFKNITAEGGVVTNPGIQPIVKYGTKLPALLSNDFDINLTTEDGKPSVKVSINNDNGMIPREEFNEIESSTDGVKTTEYTIPIEDYLDVEYSTQGENFTDPDVAFKIELQAFDAEGNPIEETIAGPGGTQVKTTKKEYLVKKDSEFKFPNIIANGKSSIGIEMKDISAELDSRRVHLIYLNLANNSDTANKGGMTYGKVLSLLKKEEDGKVSTISLEDYLNNKQKRDEFINLRYKMKIIPRAGESVLSHKLLVGASRYTTDSGIDVKDLKEKEKIVNNKYISETKEYIDIESNNERHRPYSLYVGYKNDTTGLGKYIHIPVENNLSSKNSNHLRDNITIIKFKNPVLTTLPGGVEVREFYLTKEKDGKLYDYKIKLQHDTANNTLKEFTEEEKQDFDYLRNPDGTANKAVLVAIDMSNNDMHPSQRHNQAITEPTAVDSNANISDVSIPENAKEILKLLNTATDKQKRADYFDDEMIVGVNLGDYKIEQEDGNVSIPNMPTNASPIFAEGTKKSLEYIDNDWHLENATDPDERRRPNVILFETETREMPDWLEGVEVVYQEGKNGYEAPREYKLIKDNRNNGIVAKKYKTDENGDGITSSGTEIKPIKKIIYRGTKKANAVITASPVERDIAIETIYEENPNFAEGYEKEKTPGEVGKERVERTNQVEYKYPTPPTKQQLIDAIDNNERLIEQPKVTILDEKVTPISPMKNRIVIKGTGVRSKEATVDKDIDINVFYRTLAQIENDSSLSQEVKAQAKELIENTYEGIEKTLVLGEKGKKQVVILEKWDNAKEAYVKDETSVIRENIVKAMMPTIIVRGEKARTVVKERKSFEAIPKGTDYTSDDNLFEGDEKTVVEGKDGIKTTVWVQTIANDGSGKVLSEIPKPATITTQAQNKVVARGTKQRYTLTEEYSAIRTIEPEKIEILDDTLYEGDIKEEKGIAGEERDVYVVTIDEKLKQEGKSPEEYTTREKSRIETLKKVKNTTIRKGTASVQATRIDTENANVELGTERRPNNNLLRGTERTVTKSANKVVQRKYETTYNKKTGEIISRRLIQEIVNEKGQPLVVEYGTAEQVVEYEKEIKKKEPEIEYIDVPEWDDDRQEVVQEGQVGDLIEEISVTKHWQKGVIKREVVGSILSSEYRKKIIKRGTKFTGTISIEANSGVIIYNDIFKNDDTLLLGERKIERAGVKGEHETKYRVTRNKKGKTIKRELIERKVTKEAVDSIVRVGTKQEEGLLSEIKEIPFEKVVRTNASLNSNETRVIQKGENGEEKSFYILDRSEPGVVYKVIRGNKIILKQPILEIIEGGVSVKHPVYRVPIWKLYGEENKKYVDAIPETFEEIKAMSDDEKYNLSKVNVRAHNYSKETLSYLYNNLDKTKLRSYILKYINDERAAHGVAPLEYDEKIEHFAQIRSDELATIGDIRVNNVAHVRLNGDPWVTVFDGSDFDGLPTGENLAMSSANNPYSYLSEKYIAEQFFIQWKNSKLHYENFMDPSNRAMGFAIQFSEDYWYKENNSYLGINGIVATQLFEKTKR